MSIHAMNAVWQHSMAKSGDLLVALATADFSNNEGFAFPSIHTLAKKARLSTRQTKRSGGRLHRSGELTIFKNKGPHGVNRYRLLLGDKLSLVGLSGGDTHVTQSVKETVNEPRKRECYAQ